MNLHFENPFIIAAAVLLTVVLLFVLKRLHTPFVLNLGPPGGSTFKAPVLAGTLVRICRVLEAAALLLLILAAAGPHRIASETKYLDRGADILFVLDISPSMAALDMDGKNRLEAARELVARFAERRPSDALGLAALGSDAALLVPPTVDRTAFNERLTALEIGELGEGTALGMGLAVAALHLEHSRAPLRSLVLITDGENNAGAIHPRSAAEIVSSMGITVWIIGVGSFGEVPIEYTDPESGTLRSGSFNSRFDQESLRDIARTAGGRYVRAPSAEAFDQAFSAVDRAESVVRRTVQAERRISLFFPVMAAGMILFALAACIRRLLLGALL